MRPMDTNQARGTAKELLVHYFRLVAEDAGSDIESDQADEIRDIVDAIVRAAVQETIAHLRQNPSDLALDDATELYPPDYLKDRKAKLDRLNALAAELGLGKSDARVIIDETAPHVRLTDEVDTDH